MMRFIRWLPAFFIICCSWYISSQSIVPMPSFNYADKAIHFVCYAGLAFWMAFAYKSKHLIPKDIGIPIILTSVYGIIDEIHQSFVPGRSCSVFDWIADTTGAFLGVLVFILTYTYIKERIKNTR